MFFIPLAVCATMGPFPGYPQPGNTDITVPTIRNGKIYEITMFHEWIFSFHRNFRDDGTAPTLTPPRRSFTDRLTRTRVFAKITYSITCYMLMAFYFDLCNSLRLKLLCEP